MSSETLVADRDGGLIKRSRLPGGLRVVTEFVPGVRSVAIGVWVAAGSRDEPEGEVGAAHFLEHLLFKGTKKRDAMSITSEIESVGGDFNAFTTKEYTCYHVRILDEHLERGLDVVCDVVLNASMREVDVDAERQVIFEEIAMYEDEPGELVHDEFAMAMFGETELGRPILGTVESIEGLPSAAIRDFYGRHYRPQNIVISVAGNLDHNRVVEAVHQAFDGRLVDFVGDVPVQRAATWQRPSSSNRILTRQTEQAHLVLGAPGIVRGDSRRFAAAVLNTAVGGGMSSRLFQEVREKRGLAYSVFSFLQSFADAGTFGVYVGCLPGKTKTAIDVCRTELATILEKGLSRDELERAKGQAKGSTALSHEDPAARMSRVAKAELHGMPVESLDELLGQVEAVDSEAIHEVGQLLLSGPFTLAAIGPFQDGDAQLGSM